ncbi:GPW/gp25 family protein [Occultella kanbiaonis]|uniref:GPW/gp25 family protein n=1 Tax=Occultella kanbiaonis TaxID=2675754 RepID=UPI0013D09BBD|nr:GPW/gp25 family protein [Occultella kanbiaonis]
MSIPTAEREALAGTDLRLVGDLLTAAQRERGEDLRTGPRPQLLEPGRPDPGHDLLPVTGWENLEQALLLRFLTEVGELAHLGHPTYGSRLHELIGEPNTPTTRNRAKLHALQALAEEPRVERVATITVTTDPRDATRLEVRAAVVIIGTQTELNLVVGVPLVGGAA